MTMVQQLCCNRLVNMPIQRPKPLVEQVSLELRQRIHDRTYPPGSRLPSESELAQQLGVSRTTVRTVLAKFAAEGLILRKQGDGTYVNERIRDIDNRYGGMWDFSRLIEANGYRPSIRTVTIERRRATGDESHALAIGLNEEVVSLVRLFHADGRAVIFATNVFPATLLKIDGEKLDGNLPIHRILQTYCQEQIAYAISDIEAALVDETLSGILAREAGQPLLRLKERFYNKLNKPLVMGVSYYDHTVLKLRLVQAWG